MADRDRDAKLWATFPDDFGPTRMARKKFVEIYPANSFVGNVLRLELLSQAGCSQQIIDESVDYLLYIAERTGTLWENVSACTVAITASSRTPFIFSIATSLESARWTR